MKVKLSLGTGVFGVFDRVAQLRENPLLEDIYEEVAALRNGEFAGSSNRYRGPMRDLENFRKDKENLNNDMRKAFAAAKSKLGV